MRIGGAVLALFLLASAREAHALSAQDRAALMQAHKGGILHLTAKSTASSIDPMVLYEEKMYEVTSFLWDGLVTFRKTGGPSSVDIVPDLAEAMPHVLDGGKTYVFKLRHGVYFSTGKEVTVADVVASFQRMFKVSGPNVGSWYNILVGADACLKQPATCTLAGGVVGDPATNSITLHLTQPSGVFLDELAMNFASILPADTRPHELGTTPAIGTGAYMIASYDPARMMRMVRNPYFHEWSADAQPEGYVDEIDYRFGLQDEAEVTEVENGQQDWMFDEKPLDRLDELGGKYTSQVRITPMNAYYYLTMNVRLPPFDNIDARRAVAFAVNRKSVVNLFGGPALGTPLCQLLPNGVPGYVPYCPYTLHPGTTWTAPDLAKARELVKKSGTEGMKVTLVSSDKEVERTIGIYLQSVLQDIGYQASVRAISSAIQFTYLQNSNNRVQIGLTDWYQDFPEPSDFLDVMFSCNSIHPGSDASINMAGFCDPTIEAEMTQALTLDALDKPAAAVAWAKVDRDLTDAAPAAALFQVNYLDLLSKRVGNFQFSSIYHMLFAQAWVH
jgi:peptide/nickel transport system substrate-binding protein